MCILVTGLKWRPQGETQNKQRAYVRLYWLSSPLTACRPPKYPVSASVQNTNSTKVFDALVVYIAELDISRSHVGPHFFAHRFREFCRQERDIFRLIAVTSCIQFTGDNFSRNLLTAIAFVPVCWKHYFAKSTRAYLSMRAGTHAVRWAATLGGALTPPLCRKVGSS